MAKFRTAHWFAMLTFCIPFTSLVTSAEANEPKAAAPPAVAVLVSPAAKRELAQQTEFIGRVKALEKVELRARVTGFLRERKFEVGAKVKAGQPLYTIEREPFAAALEQQKAQLASAQATLDNANLSLSRYADLQATDAASKAQLDQRVAEQKRAAASVALAKAAVEQAEITLSYTVISSPIGGRIGQSSVDPGNLVGPSSGVLATVVATDEMYVLFPVTQKQLLDARRQGSDPANLKVFVRLADNSLMKEVGRIDFLDIAVDPRTDGQMVRAIFPNPSGTLVDGQTVRVQIERKDPGTALTIPMQSIATDQGGQYVFTVDPDGTAHKVYLKLGISHNGLVAVEDGLTEGTQVVVDGLQKVRDGQKVATKQAESATQVPGGAK